MSKCILLLILMTTSVFAGLSKLEAISMIESGDNDSAVGRGGEVSRFQIKPNVWAIYSQSRVFNDTRVAAAVAERHLLYLEGIFRSRTGREPTDFDTYVLWNAGASYYGRIGFSAERVHHVVRDRASRYVNLRCVEVAPTAKDQPIPKEFVSAQLTR
jgi:hypothetical protein